MSPRLPASERQIADAVDWLRRRVAAGADLHADSRAIRPGDVFVAYAVDGADNRPHIADAVARGAAAVLYQPDSAGGSAPSAPAAHPVASLDALAGPIAGLWYGAPSEQMQMFGVTGTNGKTSCVHWIAAALDASGSRCASLGTLGCGFAGKLESTGFTTPDAPQLQRRLAHLRAAGAQAVAMEVSSHALHQGRVNGTAFDVALFTNLTQDHLDYHRTFEAYEAAKARLFDWPGLACAVINRDDAAGRRLLAHCAGRVRTVAYGIDASPPPGIADAMLSVSGIRATAGGTAFSVASDWGRADLEVPLCGAFNVANLLAVLGALLAAELPFDAAVARLCELQPVVGRMERLGGRPGSDEPLVVVDYAHTPDALEKTLDALRPLAAARGGALVCLFGCGGDRDATKRPLMGAVAERLADVVVLTSDNPRSEAPAAIIDQIAAGMRAPAAAHRIDDRADAIRQTIRLAAREDVVLLAGKGHEATQEIGGRKRPFSDQEHARLALATRAAQTREEGA